MLKIFLDAFTIAGKFVPWISFNGKTVKISRQAINRPDWDQYYIGLARVAALRSHDANSQFGCFIVSKDNTVVSMGYNGFCRGHLDDILPNVRPAEGDSIDKYPFMVHSEANAIYNSLINIRTLGGATAYITGTPCVACLMALAQNGVNLIKYVCVPGLASEWNNEKATIVRELLLEHTGVKLVEIKPDYNWIKKIFE